MPAAKANFPRGAILEDEPAGSRSGARALRRRLGPSVARRANMASETVCDRNGCDGASPTRLLKSPQEFLVGPPYVRLASHQRGHMNFTQNRGRLTGLLYLLVSIPGVFALIYVPSKVIVHGNPAATINNIAASAALFRLGIAAELISQALFILVALALYDLFKGVNQRHAVLMVTLIVVAIPIAFVNELNALATLLLVHGDDFLSIFGKPQRDALAMLFVKLHGYGFDIAAIFWGLWLFPLGLLAYRSGIVPRILGVLLIANGFTYVLNSLTTLVLPQYEHAVSRWMMPFEFGELLFMFWLLIVGASPKPSPVRASTAAVA